MPSPTQLREQARTLRDAVRTLRSKAPLLDDDTSGVLTHYPHSEQGVWWGAAATEFYRVVEASKKTLGDVATDVEGYAKRCEDKAKDLDDEADELERQQREGA